MDSDQLGASEWQEPQQYDAITCMFAIHYFFVSQAALKRFMQNVSLNLKDGERARPRPHPLYAHRQSSAMMAIYLV